MCLISACPVKPTAIQLSVLRLLPNTAINSSAAIASFAEQQGVCMQELL
jgi:hypothetical protein